MVVNYVTAAADATRVVDEIAQGGGQAIAIRTDVSDEGVVEAMFARTIDKFGTIDILVSNAGLQQDARFHEITTTAQWTRP